MREPNHELSASELVESGAAFLRALVGHEEALPVAAFFALAQTELEAAERARAEAAAAAESAFRTRDAADERLDDAVVALSLAALSIGTGDTRDPLFFKLFPEGPQAVTCAPVDVELELVRTLLDRLEGHPLHDRFAARLQQGCAEVAAAEEALVGALQREADAWARTRRAEMAWRLRGRLAKATLDRIFTDAGKHELAAHIDALLPMPAHTQPPALPPAAPGRR